jgi:hypothetical protein
MVLLFVGSSALTTLPSHKTSRSRSCFCLVLGPSCLYARPLDRVPAQGLSPQQVTFVSGAHQSLDRRETAAIHWRLAVHLGYRKPHRLSAFAGDWRLSFRSSFDEKLCSMRVHDFSLKTKRLLAQRVGYLCSSPECRALTSGPSQRRDRSITAGDAARITAASPKGPRFDPTITSEERRAYDNGIWLCVLLARVVDQDESGHSVDLLRNWKCQAEAHARKHLGRPQSRPTASSGVERFVATAKSVLIGLRLYTEDSPLLGIERSLTQMETLASSLRIPIPIEIRTIPYPEGVVPSNPFLGTPMIDQKSAQA